jgi:ferredoxin/flavodoxin
MPSCAVIYNSTTGNTKLACEYLARRIPQVEFTLYDIRDLSGFDPNVYTFIGFATYIDFWNMPKKFVDAMGRIKAPPGKEAFILMTWALFQGNGLNEMKKVVEKQGFKVVIGHAFKTPENYPPMRKRGFKKDEQPLEKDLDAFRQFIRDLGDMIVTKELKGSVTPKKVSPGFFNSLFRMRMRTDGKKNMGKKILDREACTKCGLCSNSCTYFAIRMEEYPIFDETKCHSCFGCYNLCPVGAISSEKFPSTDHRYRGPPEDLKKRLSY